MLTPEELTCATQCINSYLQKDFPDWKAKNYVLGKNHSIITLYKQIDRKNHIYRGILVAHDTLKGLIFLEEKFSREYFKENYENYLPTGIEFFLFEENKKILVLRSDGEYSPEYSSYEVDPYSITQVSVIPGKTPIRTHVYSIKYPWGRITFDISGKYLGINTGDKTFCILDLKKWELIHSLTTDPDKIPLVNDFQVFFDKDGKLLVTVLNIQHEMEAFNRRRLDICYGKGGFVSHSYMCSSGLESYEGKLEEDGFILTVHTSRAGIVKVYFDLKE